MRPAWLVPSALVMRPTVSRGQPGCGGGAALLRTPELNALTGRPLQRDGAPVYRYACAAACGYTRRTRPRRQRGRA